MSEVFDLRKSATPSTKLAPSWSFLELSGVVAAGAACRACRVVRCATRAPGTSAACLGDRALEGRASRAGHEVGRVVVGYEAGLDQTLDRAALRGTGSRSM